ncbi:MAG: BNR-4 repeat-containing protein [Novosphingobium sp.]|nr:BNR-4 repeat-containing protein [Novosphingobium sp.]
MAYALGLGISLGRGSSFTPKALFAGGAGGGWWSNQAAHTWADTAATTPATINGTVARVDDLSGNGNHLTQSNASLRPTLLSNGRQYNASTKYMASLAKCGSSGNFLAMKLTVPASASGDQVWAGLRDASGGRFMIGTMHSPGDKLGAAVGSETFTNFYSKAIALGLTGVVYLIEDGAVSSIYWNNELLVQEARSAAPATTVGLWEGANNSNGSINGPSGCTIAETLLLNRVPSADERAALFRYWDSGLSPVTQLFTDTDVNSRSYRRSAMISRTIGGTQYQVLSFWNVMQHMVLQVRSNSGAGWSAWTTCVYDGRAGRPNIALTSSDDHRAITLGIDRDGYLHISYDEHINALHYRRSNVPLSTWAGALTGELPMLGANESAVSYVQFFNDPDGKLYTIMRSGETQAFIYGYDETTGWAALAGSATGGKVLDCNGGPEAVYVYYPGFDADGNLHIAWHWRGLYADGNTNYSVSYAKWNGTGFVKSDGSSYTMPITPTNGEVADAVATTNGLGGQSNVAADDDGHPHIVYYKNNGSGKVQVYHTWHNGTAWQTPLALTSQASIAGTGDPENTQWRSPRLAFDLSTGEAFVFYNLLGVTGTYVLRSTDYASWSSTQIDTTATGEWSPTFDPYQWEQNGVFMLPLMSPTAALKLITWTPA